MSLQFVLSFQKATEIRQYGAGLDFLGKPVSFVGVAKKSMGVGHLQKHELKQHYHRRTHLNMGDVS